MKEIQKNERYEEPKIEVIRMTEKDIITTSGESDYLNQIEGEMVQ